MSSPDIFDDAFTRDPRDDTGRDLMRSPRTNPWPVVLTLVLALAGSGCESEPESGETAEGTSSETSADNAAAKVGTVELATDGNRFEFDRTNIEAAPGEELEIVFTNTADESALKHNFVQLSTDDTRTAMEVAKAGWNVPDEGYVPAHEAVVAATPVADPGETVDVSFETPSSPGKYLYICTYPAHYPSMQGNLVVREP